MSRPALNRDVIDQLRKGINVPALIKGMMTPEEADAAVKRSVQGIVISNYGGLLTPGMRCRRTCADPDRRDLRARI
jgi:isopentenyl diphosphate isomerase/L-lactate dehydrogenase-like FMN-dependent dehydrogenase